MWYSESDTLLTLTSPPPPPPPPPPPLPREHYIHFISLEAVAWEMAHLSQSLLRKTEAEKINYCYDEISFGLQNGNGQSERFVAREHSVIGIKVHEIFSF